MPPSDAEKILREFSKTSDALVKNLIALQKEVQKTRIALEKATRELERRREEKKLYADTKPRYLEPGSGQIGERYDPD